MIMNLNLNFIPRLSVTSVKRESDCLLFISVVVFPSRTIQRDSFLPPISEPYPLLHVTLQYPFEDTSPGPMDYFRLFSPTHGRPYWNHFFRMNVPLSRMPQLLRVSFWLDSATTWQYVDHRDWTLPFEQGVKLPRRSLFCETQRG